MNCTKPCDRGGLATSSCCPELSCATSAACRPLDSPVPLLSPSSPLLAALQDHTPVVIAAWVVVFLSPSSLKLHPSHPKQPFPSQAQSTPLHLHPSPCTLYLPRVARPSCPAPRAAGLPYPHSRCTSALCACAAVLPTSCLPNAFVFIFCIRLCPFQAAPSRH